MQSCIIPVFLFFIPFACALIPHLKCFNLLILLYFFKWFKCHFSCILLLFVPHLCTQSHAPLANFYFIFVPISGWISTSFLLFLLSYSSHSFSPSLPRAHMHCVPPSHPCFPYFLITWNPQLIIDHQPRWIQQIYIIDNLLISIPLYINE